MRSRLTPGRFKSLCAASLTQLPRSAKGPKNPCSARFRRTRLFLRKTCRADDIPQPFRRNERCEQGAFLGAQRVAEPGGFGHFAVGVFAFGRRALGVRVPNVRVATWPRSGRRSIVILRHLRTIDLQSHQTPDSVPSVVPVNTAPVRCENFPLTCVVDGVCPTERSASRIILATSVLEPRYRRGAGFGFILGAV